ncbi:hypothetical protein L7F22_006738 [Adiantum nelumboides]|nr:hypothetical protein [Adiantum nelumboides]
MHGSPPKNIILTCLFLAAKAESNAVPLQHFSAKVAGKGASSSVVQEYFETVQKLEFLVSQSLDFQFMVHGAHRALHGLLLDIQQRSDGNNPQCTATKVAHHQRQRRVRGQLPLLYQGGKPGPGIETSFLELGGEEEAVAATLKGSIRENTRLVWIETPTNPTLRLIDIALVAKTVKAVNPEIAVVVDSTFLSPWYQNPLALGADMVSHSITKYINGHSDVVMGALVTNSSAWAEKLKFLQNSIGAVPLPLTPGSLCAASRRCRCACRPTARLLFKLHRSCRRTPPSKQSIYPGLPSHPSFALAQRQINSRALAKSKTQADISRDGFAYGGMLSLRLKSDPNDDGPANRILENLQIFTLAESLGGVESLIELPAR